MKTITQISREKVFGLALAALAIIAGLWAIYRLGPRPEKAISKHEATNQPVSTPAPNQESARQAVGSDLFSALFKASASPLASGLASDAPAKYLGSLETIYRRR